MLYSDKYYALYTSLTVFSSRSPCYDHTLTPNGSDEADEASSNCARGGGKAACPDGPSRFSRSAIIFAPKPVSPGGLSVFEGTHDERAPPGVSWDCVAVHVTT